MQHFIGNETPNMYLACEVVEGRSLQVQRIYAEMYPEEVNFSYPTFLSINQPL